MADDLGLSMIKNHAADRFYGSNLIVETEKNVLKPLEDFEKICALIEEGLKENSNLEVNYEPFGWEISADHTKIPSLKPMSFRIERQNGISFSMQRFRTSAPLKTKQHMEILNKLESLF